MQNFKDKDLLREKLFKGGAWAFGGKVIALPLGLLINALLARILDPSDLGTFFVIQSIVAVSAMVANFGLKNTLVKYVSVHLSKEDLNSVIEVIIKSLLLIIASCLLISLLFLVGGLDWLATSFFKDPAIIGVAFIIVLWLVLRCILFSYAEIFRGFNNIRDATIFGNGGISKLFIFFYLIVLWFFYDNGDLSIALNAFVVSFGFTLFVAVLVLFWQLWKKKENGFLEYSHKISFKELLNYSWPIWITNLAFFFLNQGDIWVLGFFENQEQVALYGASLKLITLVSVPLAIANAIVPPIASEKYAKGEIEELEYSVRLASTITAVPAFLTVMLFFFFGEFILEMVYGDFYKASYLVLLLLSIGGLAKVIGGSFGVTLMMTGNQKVHMAISITTGIITLALGCVLVQFWQKEGLAFSIAIGYIINNVLGIIYVKKLLDVWTTPSVEILMSFYADFKQKII